MNKFVTLPSFPFAGVLQLGGTHDAEPLGLAALSAPSDATSPFCEKAAGDVRGGLNANQLPETAVRNHSLQSERGRTNR